MRKRMMELLYDEIKIDKDILTTCREIYQDYPELREKAKESGELTKLAIDESKREIAELKTKIGIK